MMNHLTPLISVIIPVYNVGEFLRPCLDSLVAQSYPHFEALLVDDGSTDGSGAICDEYAARDPRLRVFHQKNAGVSSARNYGMDQIRGEYVSFMDSDDLIEPDYLEVLSRTMTDDASDVVCCNFTVIDEANRPIPAHPRSFDGFAPNVKHSRIITSLDVLIDDIDKNKEVYHSHVTATLFRAEIIKTLRFPQQLKFYEDGQFLFAVFCQNRPQVSLTAYAGYHYRVRSTSVTQAVSPYALRSREDHVLLRRYQFTTLQQIGHPYAPVFLEAYGEAIHTLAYTAAQAENQSQRKRCYHLLKEHIHHILTYRKQLSARVLARILLYRYFPAAHGLLSRRNEQSKGQRYE